MDYTGFDWDESNEDHLWSRHRVVAGEVEEAFGNRPMRADAYNRTQGLWIEKRRAIIGETNDGRVLYVVFTGRDRTIRPLSARDADGSEVRRFRKWQRHR